MTTFSRRQFARAVGAGLGSTLLAPRLPGSEADARVPKGVPDDVIQINSNENPYGPSHAALDAMTASQKVAARYPDAAEKHAVDAIAALHGVAPEQVVLGCGSGEVLRLADMAFLGPEKTVVAAEPTFEAVLDYAKVTRAEAVKVPQTADYRHDLPHMAQACNERTGLVYVCNPNNPTGTIVTRDELAAFLAAVPKTAVVLVDEAYHHFVEDPRYSSAADWVGRMDNLVVARTFSKIYGMAGMRLGYAVGPKPRIDAMRQHVIWSNANAAVLAAAVASLADADHVPRYRAMLNSTRRWLCGELDREGRRYTASHANFLMIDVGSDVSPVIQAFGRSGILVGRKFPSMGSWLRVSVGTRPEMEAFLAALRTIVPAGAGKAA